MLPVFMLFICKILSRADEISSASLDTRWGGGSLVLEFTRGRGFNSFHMSLMACCCNLAGVGLFFVLIILQQRILIAKQEMHWFIYRTSTFIYIYITSQHNLSPLLISLFLFTFCRLQSKLK